MFNQNEVNNDEGEGVVEVEEQEIKGALLNDDNFIRESSASKLFARKSVNNKSVVFGKTLQNNMSRSSTTLNGQNLKLVNIETEFKLSKL